jgi:hypothetical protein
MDSQLEGLPEGVQAVRFGIPQEDKNEFVLEVSVEYDLHDGDHKPRLRPPLIRGRGFGLIVVAAPGYYIAYDINTDSCRVVKTFEQPKTLQVKFRLANEHDEQAVRSLIAHCPGEKEIQEG